MAAESLAVKTAVFRVPPKRIHPEIIYPDAVYPEPVTPPLQTFAHPVVNQPEQNDVRIRKNNVGRSTTSFNCSKCWTCWT